MMTEVQYWIDFLYEGPLQIDVPQLAARSDSEGESEAFFFFSLT